MNLHLMFTLPALYVLGRFLWPLPWRRAAKLGVAALVLLGSQYHLFNRISSGSPFAPEMPRALIIVFNWAFGAILLLAAMQILLDLAALAIGACRRQRVRIPGRARLAIGLVAVVLAAIGVSQAIRVPPVKDVEIAIADLPPAFDGYTMLQLTDLHLTRMFDARWSRAVVDRSNTLGVDLIVVTGDLIDGSMAARERDVAPLRDLRAPDGVFVIPGNHEYYFTYRAWMDSYRAMGMTPLDNRHAILRRGNAQLVLAGVTDVTAPRMDLPGPDLDAALAGAPEGVPIVLLEHQPRLARRSAARGVALQLSGHTHGGMIFGMHWLLTLFNGGFVSGRYALQDMTLYVNNGTALWPGFALRLGQPSELTRITLRRQAERRTGGG